MPAAHKGAISFGLVHIPVSLHTATQSNEVRFNQLCTQDLSRVRYKKICSGCGEEAKDIVKGFEYEKGKYVVIDEKDFEKIKTKKDHAIQILHFTDLTSIPPIYYDKTYHAIPQTGGEKAYELLRIAMMQAGKIAIGKTVLRTKETLLAIIPIEQGLLVETMFYEDEIKELVRPAPKSKVADAELTMAQQLIASLDKPFEPELYHDAYQERLRELIQTKIAGKEVVKPKEEKQSNIINLMDALKASLEQTDKPKQKKKASAKKPAAKKAPAKTKKAKGA